MGAGVLPRNGGRFPLVFLAELRGRACRGRTGSIRNYHLTLRFISDFDRSWPKRPPRNYRVGHQLYEHAQELDVATPAAILPRGRITLNLNNTTQRIG